MLFATPVPYVGTGLAEEVCVCAFPELRPMQLPGAGGWRRCGEQRIPEGRLGGCGARAQAMAHDVKGRR